MLPNEVFKKILKYQPKENSTKSLFDEDTQDNYDEILKRIQSLKKSENNNFIEFLKGLKLANIEESWNNQVLIIASLDKFSHFPNWQDCLEHLPPQLTEEHTEQIKNQIEKLTQLSPASTISHPKTTSSKQQIVISK